MWVHCRLWASTNLTGRFLLTFPHGYVHIWVEFISPLLFVTATFTYNPQLLSSGASPSCCCMSSFPDSDWETGQKDKKNAFDERKTGLFALIFHRPILTYVKAWISFNSQCLFSPPHPNPHPPPPNHLYTRRSSTDSGQLWKQLEEDDRKRHLRGNAMRWSIIHLRGPPQLISFCLWSNNLGWLMFGEQQTTNTLCFSDSDSPAFIGHSLHWQTFSVTLGNVFSSSLFQERSLVCVCF